MSIEVEHERQVAELRRDLRAADKLARREERAERQADRRARRAERAERTAALGRRVRPVLPLVVVTGFAGYGQVLFGLDQYSPAGWPGPTRVAVAVGVAIGIESISLYVQWHAHDALIIKATATAARLRRASYLIALGVAALVYSHFSGDSWEPTPSAVVFGAFTLSSPWLWGLHTRRVQRLQLTREGHVDATGAVFSLERARAFPVRTWGARRWSIDHGVTDPRVAWEGYNAARAERRAERRRRQAVEDESDLPDRRGHVNTADLKAVLDDLRSVSAARGRRYVRDEIREMYGIRSDRAMTVRRMLGWADGSAPVAPTTEVAS